ncbi:hypothetical protein FUT12_15055 [Bacillus mycoides]|nr:hypothetical protein [Bacillus mycoides]
MLYDTNYLYKLADFFEFNLETELRKKLDEVRARSIVNKKIGGYIPPILAKYCISLLFYLK